jgi:hypothetical protein
MPASSITHVMMATAWSGPCDSGRSRSQRDPQRAHWILGRAQRAWCSPAQGQRSLAPQVGSPRWLTGAVSGRHRVLTVAATPAHTPGGHAQQRRSEPPVREAVSPHRSPVRARSATAPEAASVSDRQPASSSGVQPTPTAQASGDGTLPPPVRRAGQAAAVVLAGGLDYATVVRNRPRTLATWRVTTTSRRTADRVAQLLGGRVQQDLTSGLVEVLTTSPTVDILLTGLARFALTGSTPPPAATASPRATATRAPAPLGLRGAEPRASRAAAANPAPSSGSGSPAARASAPSALPARTGHSSS